MGKFISINGREFGKSSNVTGSANQQRFNDTHCKLGAKTTQEAFDLLFDKMTDLIGGNVSDIISDRLSGIITDENSELVATDEDIDNILNM